MCVYKLVDFWSQHEVLAQGRTFRNLVLYPLELRALLNYINKLTSISIPHFKSLEDIWKTETLLKQTVLGYVANDLPEDGLTTNI